MAFTELIESLERLIVSHKELLACTEEKTSILVEGKMNELERILLDEQKLIKKIEKEELLRMAATERYIKELGLQKQDSQITKLLEFTKDPAKQTELENKTIELVEIITKLKKQEEMNKGLLTQSMQFVQLSLNTMNPTLNNLNYGAKSKASPHAYNRSMYDSEA